MRNSFCRDTAPAVSVHILYGFLKVKHTKRKAVIYQILLNFLDSCGSEAYEKFEALGDYEDSEKYLEELLTVYTPAE